VLIYAFMRILLADDHELLRDGIRRILGDMDGDVSIREAASFADVLAALEVWPGINLILMDLSMPGMDGVHSLAMVRRIAPATPLVIISATEDEQTIQAAIQVGASGYIPKSSSLSVIQSAIRMVLDGGIYLPPHIMNLVQSQDAKSTDLTPRQIEVLSLLAQGLSNKCIAREMKVVEGTVKQHVHAIFEQLDLSNRTQAVLKAREMGLI